MGARKKQIPLCGGGGGGVVRSATL